MSVVQRGRMVNRVTDELLNQLHERHALVILKQRRGTSLQVQGGGSGCAKAVKLIGH